MSSSIPNPKNPSKNIIRGPGGRFVKASTSTPPLQKTSIQPQSAPLAIRTKKVPRHFLAALLLAIVGIVLLFLYIFKDLPSPSRLGKNVFPVSTKIYDRNGNLLYDIFANQNRTPIKLSELPPYVKEATISVEDKDFYKHRGLAITGIARALLKNTQYLVCRVFVKNCDMSFQGGSTITQQLVKTALLTPERTLRRKIRELVLTFAVESIYSKDQILEMYLNQVPYGGTSYGIESAAENYFGKKAKDLTLPEAALLAGLPAAPTRFSPFGAHPELAKERQQFALRRMQEDGYLKPSEKESAENEQLKFSPPQVGIKAPHFVLYVKDLLVQKYGELLVETGGLRVTTSLDINLQNFAQQTVASEVAKLKKAKVSNGAALITIPATGEILSMVGSADYFNKENDGNVNVTLRPRQPGSSIKPLNYAMGIENNLVTAATPLIDLPTCFQVSGQPAYCPENYDRSFHGPTHLRFALGNSFNIPAVKMLTLNSLRGFVDKAHEFGITTFTDPDNYGLSLTLGGGEVKMVDMAVAFGVLANQGIRQELHPILKIEDYTGKLLEEYKPATIPNSCLTENTDCPSAISKVVSPETAYIISHILLDNNARSQAFGPSSFLNVSGHPEVSVKTGTTNDKRDNWTIGYNPDRLAAVWVGNNDNTPLGAVASGVTGASPIWNRIIKESLKDFKPNWPQKPDSVVGQTICSISGLLPPNPTDPASCLNGQFRFEYFRKDNLIKDSENPRRDIPVDKNTNIQATTQTLPENIVYQNHAVIFDPLGAMLCIDCAGFPTDPQTIKPINFITPTPTPAN